MLRPREEDQGMTRFIGVLKPLLMVTALAGMLSACHHYHGGGYGYGGGGYYGSHGPSQGYHRGYRGGYYR